MVATASITDGLLWVWKLGTPAVLVIPEAADNCTLESVAFHPNGKYVAVGGLDWLATRATMALSRVGPGSTRQVSHT